MRSAKYLDAVIERHGLKNDKALAEYLGLVHSAVSHYRTGRRVMDNETCLRIAQALEMENPLLVIMAADMDRAERAGQHSLWEVFSRRMTNAAAPATLAALVAVVTNFMTPTPAQAAPTLDREGGRVIVMLNDGGLE
ncbi:helix-turn-helix domain-containing protein [Cupriavidus sp. CuC1]|uniref:helix-turn-helix domain-containing protein n=1 Tax=Cupriavidus sp. CuC1 TaxID=3373131 RepID=UPI0037D2E74F